MVNFEMKNSLWLNSCISPSDSRMSSWGPVTYTVGTSAQSAFPMALFKDVGPVTIKFTLTSSQRAYS